MLNSFKLKKVLFYNSMQISKKLQQIFRNFNSKKEENINKKLEIYILNFVIN